MLKITRNFFLNFLKFKNLIKKTSEANYSAEKRKTLELFKFQKKVEKCWKPATVTRESSDSRLYGQCQPSPLSISRTIKLIPPVSFSLFISKASSNYTISRPIQPITVFSNVSLRVLASFYGQEDRSFRGQIEMNSPLDTWLEGFFHEKFFFAIFKFFLDFPVFKNSKLNTGELKKKITKIFFLIFFEKKVFPKFSIFQ